MDDASRRLRLPNDEAPESWLGRYDSKPCLLPKWPPSASMVLIAVSKEMGAEDTWADVITRQEQVEALLKSDAAVRNLFFQMPRATFLRSQVCGVEAKDFEY